MRCPLAALALGLGSCLATPAMEPVGGFTLGEVSVLAWSECSAPELEGWMAAADEAARGLRDYRATLESSERIEDELYPRRVMTVWVMHAPFRVAIVNRAPPEERGQRVWYDSEEGDLVAETPGLLGKLVGRVSLDPAGDLARKNRRHPITDIGLLRLVEQLRAALGPALATPARIRAGQARIGEHEARLVEVLVPARAAGEPAHLYRFACERTSGLVIYCGEAELLPDGPAVLEEYLYRDLAPDLGLTAADFAPGATPQAPGATGATDDPSAALPVTPSVSR